MLFFKNEFGANLSKNTRISRVMIVGGHAHGVYVKRHDNSFIIEDSIIRPYHTLNWAIGKPGGADPGLQQIGISTREYGAGYTMTLNNVVLPTEINTYWYDSSKIIGTNIVRSDTGLPIGWASTPVAQNKIGIFEQGIKDVDF
jgi:hypothetical protein